MASSLRLSNEASLYTDVAQVKYRILIWAFMHFNLYSLNLNETQAVWTCRNSMVTLELPYKDDMCAEIAHWEEKASDANKNNNFEKVFFYS